MIVTNVIHLQDDKIIRLHSMSTSPITMQVDENSPENLSSAKQNKKRFLYTLEYRKKTTTDDTTLTSREIECLYLTILGLSAKEIARELGISDRTVNKHIENCRHKYGVDNIIELTKLFRLV